MKLSAITASVLGALLLGVVLANTVIPFFGDFDTAGVYTFQVNYTAKAGGFAQLYHDSGRGLNEGESTRVRVEAGKTTVLVFPLRVASVRGLRFDPLDGDDEVSFDHAVILRPDGEVSHRFAPADFTPGQQIAELRTEAERIIVRATPGSTDPTLQLRLGTDAIALPVTWSLVASAAIGRGLPWAGVIFILILIWRFLPASSRTSATDQLRRLRLSAGKNPRLALLTVSLAAAVLSSYPVVFGGASYVSPDYGSVLLYQGFPTLPGEVARSPVEVRGADVGAIMWQQVPESALQARALLHDHELPLWKRANSGGTPLLGQGQAMLGDPLHVGVLLTGGAAWAWDVKYVAAKWLLGLALGLVVLHTTRHLVIAMVIAFASVFAGFFVFRVNHPAFFSFCYSPLVLYAWCRLSDARDRRALYGCAVALLGANWMLLTSGTVKEAYVLLLTLNFSGALLLLGSSRPWPERGRQLGSAVLAGGIFILISTPLWLTFLNTLHASYSTYEEGRAFQVPPGVALGFFDEVLLRPFWSGDGVYNPSSNFLILLGVLAYLVNVRRLAADGQARAVGFAALVLAAFVFGLIPGHWIATWPFLGNIHHIDNCFGLALIHLCAVLAGFGWVELVRRWETREGRGDLALLGLLLFGLTFLYVGSMQAVQRSTMTFVKWNEGPRLSGFVRGDLIALLLASVGLLLAGRYLRQQRRFTAGATCVLAACALVLLWRHGLQWRSRFPDYTLNAAPRADFSARSPAVEAARADMKEPARLMGFEDNFFPGWSAVYGLEGVTGADALINPAVRELQEAFGLPRIWDWRIRVLAAELPQYRPFFDLFNVRYYFNTKGEPGPAGTQLTPVVQSDLDLYRSETAWPRAFFVDRVARYGTPQEFAQLVRDGDGRPLAAVASSDSATADLPRGDLAGRRVVPATAYQLTNNTTTFTIDAPSAGVIVLTEAWLHRDFLVTVNDQPARYVRINHAFKGVAVPQGGTYRVAFRYRPRLLNLSLALAAAGVVLVGGAGWFCGRRPATSSEKAPAA